LRWVEVLSTFNLETSFNSQLSTFNFD
jgi:hypothetical protein